ncbi:hypothetical protein BH09MYX1_BH09MYX1_65570 [soil metagenome]
MLPPGTKCKSLKVTWNPPKEYPGAAGQGYVDRDSGTVHLATSRSIDGGYLLLFANGEGAVESAMFVSSQSTCSASFGRQSLSANAWGFEVYDSEKHVTRGLLAGDDLSMNPSLAVSIIDGDSHTVSTGSAGVLDMNVDYLLYDPAHPDAGARKVGSLKDGEGLGAAPNLFEDVATWVSEGSVSMKVRLYHDAKTVSFIDYSGIDVEHGAGCLGGDGKDMVWVEGFGLENAGRYKTAAYFTSPYTTDPSKLQSRRLRSDSFRVLDVNTTVVGCGYAAHSEGRSLRIIRISDGVSWLIPASAADASFEDSISWPDPFAISCTEVWVQTERVPVRIDISSLGPGIPPD